MQINLFRPGNRANGYVSSSSTGKSYRTLTEALVSGQERIKDCNVEWDLGQITKSKKELDQLYDEQMIYLRERYDLLELSYGGGHDSSYLLEIASRNNIQIDLISMMGVDTLQTEHPWNKEFHWNWKHMERYLDKFPKTKLEFMDFGKLWSMVQEQDRDWTQSKLGLEDICGLASDRYLSRRTSDNRALLTGRGWKKILYNKEFDCWSMFQASDQAHSVLCYSDVSDVVYFFGTPDIIIKQCRDARDLAINTGQHHTSKENVWVCDDTWMQKKVLYKKMPFEIKRFPKVSKEFDHQFNHPKMSWYCQDKTPTDPKLHYKYWKYIDYVNEKVHRDDVGGVLPDLAFPDIVKVVDF